MSTMGLFGIISADTPDMYGVIEELSREILPRFYAPTVPSDHVDFFIDKYLTEGAIGRQVQDGFEYFLLQHARHNAGYLGIRCHPDCILLDKLYILPEFRSLGMGGSAVGFVHDRARGSGIGKVELIVHQDNWRAIRFYEELGYGKGEIIVKSFENGHAVPNYYMSICFT